MSPEEIMAGVLRHHAYDCLPLWGYHQTFEPVLQAMRDRGEAVRLSLDMLTGDCDANAHAEICRRDALALDGWYEPAAAVSALLREAEWREREAAREDTHPTWRAYDARYASRLREVAAGIKVQS